MLQIKWLAAVLVVASAGGEDTAQADTCAAAEPAPWEAALEDWATAARGNLTRHGEPSFYTYLLRMLHPIGSDTYVMQRK